MGFFDKLALKKYDREAQKVMAFESQMAALSNEELQAKTPYFKDLLANGKTLEDIKYEAFAVVREAAKRTLGEFPYKVQIIGSLVLNNGDVAELKTGEGKTLTATMAVYLNALSGKGVHVITVNDYLAKRDSEWMGKLYKFLGLSVGLVIAGMRPDHRLLIAYTTESRYLLLCLPTHYIIKPLYIFTIPAGRLPSLLYYSTTVLHIRGGPPAIVPYPYMIPVYIPEDRPHLHQLDSLPDHQLQIIQADYLTAL